MQGDTLIGRDKQDCAPPQCEVREGGSRGSRGFTFNDEEDAGTVNWSDVVLLHRGRDLQEDQKGEKESVFTV